MYFGWLVVSFATAAAYVLFRYLYQVLYIEVQKKKLNEYTQLIHSQDSEIEDFVVAIEIKRPEVSTQQHSPNAHTPDGALL